MCLGDRPEYAFAQYRAALSSFGHKTTVEYLVRACRMALNQGLLPHTNAGVLTRDEMSMLKPVNASLGLMLESVSPRLMQRVWRISRLQTRSLPFAFECSERRVNFRWRSPPAS